jgi:hypothetical protein
LWPERTVGFLEDPSDNLSLLRVTLHSAPSIHDSITDYNT